jgi:hypothetical protein
MGEREHRHLLGGVDSDALGEPDASCVLEGERVHRTGGECGHSKGAVGVYRAVSFGGRGGEHRLGQGDEQQLDQAGESVHA